MAVIFKTYNGQHQLHLQKELWVLKTKTELNEVLSLFSKKEAQKARIIPQTNYIELELNQMIVECKDKADLKKKFELVVNYKDKFQKMISKDKEIAQKS